MIGRVLLLLTRTLVWYSACINQAWWHMFITPAFKRQRQENQKFKAITSYTANMRSA